jgi:phage terminase Nu1 subunit (DNA packaging protein)
MKLALNPQTICTTQELAGVLGISVRQIDRLRVSKDLKPVRGQPKWRFRLGESVQAYLRHREKYVTERLQIKDDAYGAARVRKMEAAASMLELQLAAQRGDYLLKRDVEFHLSTLLRNARDRLLSIPSRCMYQMLGLSDAKVANRILTSEVETALTEVADRKCFDWARMRKEQIAFLQEEGFTKEQAIEMANETDRLREARTDRNGESPED